MSEHRATIEWALRPHETKSATYSRSHTAHIGEEVAVPMSAAPGYLGDPALADPEQMLVAALASCHMLYFLALCEGSGFSVAAYRDEAVGTVEKKADGGFWVSSVALRPEAAFSGGKIPDRDTLERLHQRAHKGCFIANSVKSAVTITPR